MGREWKQRQKQLLGNPVSWHDVVSANVTAISGVATPTTMSPVSAGAQRFRAPRAGYVDYVVADITPAVSSGVASVAVYHGGDLVASGQFSSSNPRVVERMFSHRGENMGPIVALASGTDTHVEYAVSTALNETGTQGYAVNVRVGLRYTD